MVHTVESEKKDKALKLQKNFGPHGLLKEMNLDETICSVYPNCYKLFYYLLLFPLSTACIEILFSKMKLIKTCLRNNLSQSTLENLLFIATEAPKDFHDDHYKHLNAFTQKRESSFEYFCKKTVSVDNV